MHILFSGVAQETFSTWWSETSENLFTSSLVTTSDFLNILHSPGEVEHNCRLVWLYQSPWRLITQEKIDSVAHCLQAWLGQQKTIIELNRVHPEFFKIVNLETTSDSFFKSTSAVFTTKKTPANQGVDKALLELFELFAPQYWDTFEALESVSWSPSGQGTFRSNISPSTEKDFFALLQKIKKSENFDLLEKELQGNISRISNLENELLNFNKTKHQLDKINDQVINLESTLAIERKKSTKVEQELLNLNIVSEARIRQIENAKNLIQAQLNQTQTELLDFYEVAKNYETLIKNSREALESVNNKLDKRLQNA